MWASSGLLLLLLFLLTAFAAYNRPRSDALIPPPPGYAVAAPVYGMAPNKRAATTPGKGLQRSLPLVPAFLNATSLYGLASNSVVDDFFAKVAEAIAAAQKYIDFCVADIVPEVSRRRIMPPFLTCAGNGERTMEKKAWRAPSPPL